MKTKIYFNSRCSTCRKTLGILEERNIEFEIHEYLKEPLTEDQLLRIMDQLGTDFSKIVRTKEQSYKDLEFDITDHNVVAHHLSKDPSIIQRPIVVHNGRAIVARPPEEVLKILD